jgi:hypothetical protein
VSQPLLEIQTNTVSDTLNEYKQGTTEACVNQLQPVYEELVARLDGPDANRRPLETLRGPTQVDIDSLAALEDELSKPLDDDVLQIRDRTGNVTDVRLGDAIRKCEIKSEEKHVALAELIDQLKDVEDAIAEAQKFALRSEQTEVKKLRDELAVQLEELKDEALEYKEHTEADVDAAIKAEKKAKKEWEAKIAALMD